MSSVGPLGNCWDSYDYILQRPLYSSPVPLTEDDQMNNEYLIPKSMAEVKAAAASNSHKEAERRRRKRINDHIVTLKAILPNVHKTDKASLLGEAVQRVKELRQTTTEYLTAIDHTDEVVSKLSTNLDLTMMPTETDELKICPCEGDSGLIKATLCCEDSPDIMLELIQALSSVKAKVKRSEMCSIGGRTKNTMWLELVSPNINVGGERDLGLGKLRQVLKMVLDKSTLLAAGSGQTLPGNKRPRFFQL